MSQVTTPPDRTPGGWGRVADAYDTQISPFTAQYAHAALDATGLQAGERTLDVAAGSGALSLEAARREAKVVAIDFAPQMVDRLKGRAEAENLDVDARVMDGQALDLPDATFDAAYSCLGVMFFPSPDRGLAEMRRVLRPGGRAAVVVWAAPERSESFSAFFGAMQDAVPELPPPPEPPSAFSLADPVDLKERMQKAGFRDVRVERVVRQFTSATPELGWDAFTQTNPVLPEIFARVGPDNIDKIRDAFLRRARDMMRDGELMMNGEANLAIGHA